MTIRSDIRKALIDKNYNPADADEIVDLSMHIAKKVAEVFPQIASTASSSTNELNVILVSSSLVIAQVTQARDIVLAILGDVAEAAEIG